MTVHLPSRRTSLIASADAALTAAVAAAGVHAYARFVEPRWVEVVRLELPLPGLAPEFDGYRIVQISDLHLDGRTSARRTSRFLRLVNGQRPDLVAITGDFVTVDSARFAGDVAALLRRLAPRDATVAVLGNHDHQSDPEPIREALRDAGAVDLSNAVHTVRRGEAALHVAGVDCVWEHKNRLDLVLVSLPPAGAAVLLAHEPDFADISAATGRFALQLSGHSHGGQVHLPLLGPPRLTQLAERYFIGRYQVDGMALYVNRGLGMLPPRIRFLCRPEITVIVLRAPAGG